VENPLLPVTESASQAYSVVGLATASRSMEGINTVMVIFLYQPAEDLLHLAVYAGFHHSNWHSHPPRAVNPMTWLSMHSLLFLQLRPTRVRRVQG